MAPTTLITFMVRTPSATRSVSLYGSWDNFTKPYSMIRDSRVGPEHWTGCHKFTSIIFDGARQPSESTRDGALKMGGTYWYYYKLDDDLEFYNSAEPTTTQCPLLPGQLVNILQMPYNFSGSRSRNASVSSTNSEKRTMNPGDKYLNPRPVPKPKLHRLQTSPTSMSRGWSSSAPPSSAPRAGLSATSDKSSAPSSTVTVRRPLLSRKVSLDSHSKTPASANGTSVGLKTAFRSFRSPRSASPDEQHEYRARELDRRLDAVIEKSNASRSAEPQRTLTSSRDPSPLRTRGRRGAPDHDLAFRRRPTSGSSSSLESFSTASFAEHRRQRSRSREQSSVRDSLLLEDMTTVPADDAAQRKKQLSTVKEVASAQNTPAFVLDGPKLAEMEKAMAELDLEKRLPTLPNTPSSAYPSGFGNIDGPISGEAAPFESHFSTTTIDTSSSEPSSATNSARFSNFSSAYTGTTRSSTHSGSLIDEQPVLTTTSAQPQTPKTGRTEAGTDIEDTPQPSATLPPQHMSLAPTFSSSAISSTTVSSLSTSPSHYDMDAYETGWPARSSSRDRLHYQHYRLPADEHGSEITLKPQRDLTSRNGEPLPMPFAHKVPFQHFIRDKPPPQHGFHKQLPTGGQDGHGNAAAGVMPHSNSMQQLLNELSYLGDMIHHQ